LRIRAQRLAADHLKAEALKVLSVFKSIQDDLDDFFDFKGSSLDRKVAQSANPKYLNF